MGKPIGEMEEFARAKRPQRLPEVMTREEVEALLSNMDGVAGLMAGLLYGSGMRLMECVRLRVKDIDFARSQIMVRDGKGQKDRITMLPERFAAPLKEHLGRVRAMYEQDLSQGMADISGLVSRGSIPMPVRNGSGSMCFRPRVWRSIPGAARCVGTTSMKLSSRRP
jgi:site-specific recombinase XerD